jgi:hypothetical protein
MEISRSERLAGIAVLLLICVAGVAGQEKKTEGSPAGVNVPQLEDAWAFPDFSATQVMQAAGFEMPAKIYRSGSAVRVQKTDTLGTLYMPALGKIYDFTTYPDGSRQCVVMRTDQARGLPSPLELLFGIKVIKTSAGTETVEGHDCKVEKVTVTRPDGTKVESQVWEAEDLKGIPVKIVSQMEGAKFTVVYRNIVMGEPDKALMDQPGKCTPLEKMGQVAEHTEYK